MTSTGMQVSMYSDTAGQKITNCQLCFKEYNNENTACYSPKLYKQCCKYLHSALTKGTSSSHSKNESLFCQRCFESAVKLFGLSEQIQFFQKSLSELIFIFSLEILHRRGNITDNVSDFFDSDNVTGHDEDKTDISASPNENSWSFSSSVSSTPAFAENKPEAIISKNKYTDEVPSLNSPRLSGNQKTLNIPIEEIKCEVKHLDWINENSDLEDFDVRDVARNQAESFPVAITANDSHSVLLKRQSTNTNFTSSRKEVIVRNSNTDNLQSKNTEIRNTKKPTKRNSASFKITNENQSRPVPTEGFPLRINVMTVSPSTSSSFFETEAMYRTEEAAFKCSLCPKAFLQSSALIRHHQNEHKKQNPFKCQTCGKEFVFQCHLKVHVRTHTKEKPFKCQTCSKRFIQKHDLVRHIRTHTGEKPFQCDQCDYAAVQYHALKAHKKRHSEVKNFKCKECDKNFKTVDDLKSHYKRIHFALDFSDDCIVENN